MEALTEKIQKTLERRQKTAFGRDSWLPVKVGMANIHMRATEPPSVTA